MADQQQRAELAAFLRARREALSPEQVKLPRGRARRTPGLRREEVALLAGVSVTWYTWLEQGRRINASTDVLRSIGRALRLDDVGQEHLVSLAQPTAPTGQPLAAPDAVPSALRRLIETFEPAPAYVLGPHWEFAAWNAAEARLYPPLDRLEGVERNLIWVLFAHPAVRQLIVDWDIHARQALAEFRAATIAVRRDPQMVDLVDRLSAVSDEFRTWWPEHDVAALRDPPAPLQPPPRRPVDVRVPAADAVGVAVTARRRAAAGARRRLGATPRGPPRRLLTPAHPLLSFETGRIGRSRRTEPGSGPPLRRELGAPGRVAAPPADDDGGDGVGGAHRGLQGVDVAQGVAAAAVAVPPRHESGRERVAGADRVDDRHGVDRHGRRAVRRDDDRRHPTRRHQHGRRRRR